MSLFRIFESAVSDAPENERSIVPTVSSIDSSWLQNPSFPDIQVTPIQASIDETRTKKRHLQSKSLEAKKKRKESSLRPSSPPKVVEECFCIDRKYERGALGFSGMNPRLLCIYTVSVRTPLIAFDDDEVRQSLLDSRRSQKDLLRRQRMKKARRYFSRFTIKTSRADGLRVEGRENFLELTKLPFLSLSDKSSDASAAPHRVLTQNAEGKYVLKEEVSSVTSTTSEVNDSKKDLKPNEYWHRQVTENPHHVEGWLEYSRSQLWDPFSKERSTTTAERRVSILDRALESNPRSIPLIIERLNVCFHVLEPKTLLKEWEKWLFRMPNSLVLWREYMKYLCSQVDAFSVESVIRAYDKAFEKLNQIRSGKFLTHQPTPTFDEELLEFFGSYCDFLWQSGLYEKAVGTWQALLEFNMYRPKGVPNDSLLDVFEPFWDSRARRIGEFGSIGWAASLELSRNGQSEPSDSEEPDLGAKEDQLAANESLSRSDRWLMIETLRSQHHFLPWEGQASDELEDDARTVHFHEVEPFLWDFRSSQQLMFRAVLRALQTFHVHSDGRFLNPLLPPEARLVLPGSELKSFDIPFRAFPSDMHPSFLTFLVSLVEQTIPILAEPHYKTALKVLHLRLLTLSGSSLDQCRKIAKRHIRDCSFGAVDIYRELGMLEMKHASNTDGLRTLETVSKAHFGADFTKSPDVVQLFATYASLIAPEKQLPFAVAVASNGESGSSAMLRARTRLRSIQSELAVQVGDADRCFCDGLVSHAFQSYIGWSVLHSYYLYWTQEKRLNAVVEFFDACILEVGKNQSLIHELVVSKLRMAIRHITWKNLSLAYLRPHLEKSLEMFPSDSHFLALLIQVETNFPVALNLRRYFKGDQIVSTSDVQQALFAVWAETTRLSRFGELDVMFNTCIGNRLKSLIELFLRSTSSSDLRGNSVLWRFYLQVQRIQGGESAVRKVYFQALDQCPGCKEIYLDIISYCPSLLSEVHHLMVEKGLRVRLPLEEFDVLCEPLPSADDLLESETAETPERRRPNLEVLQSESSFSESDFEGSDSLSDD